MYTIPLVLLLLSSLAISASLSLWLNTRKEGRCSILLDKSSPLWLGLSFNRPEKDCSRTLCRLGVQIASTIVREKEREFQKLSVLYCLWSISLYSSCLFDVIIQGYTSSMRRTSVVAKFDIFPLSGVVYYVNVGSSELPSWDSIVKQHINLFESTTLSSC